MSDLQVGPAMYAVLAHIAAAPESPKRDVARAVSRSPRSGYEAIRRCVAAGLVRSRRLEWTRHTGEVLDLTELGWQVHRRRQEGTQ